VRNKLIYIPKPAHVLRKEDNDCMKKCMEYEVGMPGQEVDQRKLGQRLWEKTVKHVD